MLTTRERFHAVMAGRPVDRLPVIEWANWWSQTIARWHTEGLPAELTDRYDIVRHFGLDLYKQAWLRSVHPESPQPASHGAGIIQTESDYDRLQPFLFQLRDDWPINPTQWRQWAEDQKRGEAVLWFTVDGFFWLPRVLLGIERHLYAFYDQPELMHRINAENARWMIRLIDRLCEYCVPDFMTFAEDLSYNHGPMLSAELFEEFLAPYYRQVIPHLRARGIIPIVDSDGDVSQVAPWFEGVGVAGILPLERQAGVDVVALRQKHPALNWIAAPAESNILQSGNFDGRNNLNPTAPVAPVAPGAPATGTTGASGCNVNAPAEPSAEQGLNGNGCNGCMDKPVAPPTLACNDDCMCWLELPDGEHHANCHNKKEKS